MIGDSMVRHLPKPLGARVYCIRGAKLEVVANLIRGWTVRGQRTLDVAQFRSILLHVGTNNVGQSLDRIQDNFRFLVDAAQLRCPGASVYLSSVPPRPIDWFRTGEQVVAINQWLEQWAPPQGARFINSYRLFTFGRTGIAESLYKDGLHLNSDGLKKLEDKFRQMLGDDH